MLKVRWQAPDNLPFPMPLDVRVDGKIVTLPMTDGTGETPAGAQAGGDHRPGVEGSPATGCCRCLPGRQAKQRPR